MHSENEISKDDPITLIAKLHPLAARLNSENNREAKRACLQLSKALTAQLEEPEDAAINMAFSPVIAFSARTAIDLDLFKHIVQKGPVTSATLVALTGAEELLIIRILRVLSSVHFVKEVSARTWIPTPITKAMAMKEIAAGHRFISGVVVPAMQNAPDYFLQHGYSCPTDTKDGLVQYALKTAKSTFEYIISDPSLLKDFNLFMGNGMGARKSWLDWYPVQSQILDDANIENALIVDVGGGKGRDLIAFHEKFPSTGRLVLEDLPAVMEDLGKYGTVIEQVGYDFLTEQQPVKGARAYLCHHILHDWPDSYCLRILGGIASAMTPGYSKLLLHEGIVPEQGACHFQAMSDIAAMVCNGGMERTRQQWDTLLETAGLQVVKFWESPDQGGDGIIEAVKL
ncbi:o-methyltransferase [Aspergillus cavernicola]|uniref:O-methyltransferase n=1 Tax=Aspergillus cavernicola TaxID=176166 RepID=A0ABR4HN85_9EURO